MCEASNLTQRVVSSDLLNEQYNVSDIVTLFMDAGLFFTIAILLIHALKKIYSRSQNDGDASSISHNFSQQCINADLPDEHGCKLQHVTPI